LPLKLAHLRENDDTIRYGKMIVFACGNGLPFPDRSLVEVDARPHYSCSSESVRWRNAAVYPVALVQTAIAQVVTAESAVGEVVHAYEHENNFIYCIDTIPINSS
jgi:hypothetical protein